MRFLVCASIGLIATALVSGCESTQDKSARLAKEGGGAVHERGLTVGRQNPDVKIVSTATVQDKNGTAVVVDMRNTGRRVLANLPVGIDVKGPAGKSLFRNNAAGLEQTLIEAPLLFPGKDLLWVNDQVSVASKPQRVDARVGREKKRVAGSLPKLEITNVKVTNDPVDGPEASGSIVNKSGIEQLKLIVFGVARSGRKVVAAGRGQVNRLKAHKKARFTIFFIGDPRRGRLTLSAPPTVLR
jgi:hypothetical protein